MKPNVIALLLAGALALPGTLRAQHAQHHPQGQDQPQQGMMGQGMMGQGMMGMMSVPGPGMILMQKDALGLSESQVERLEALREEVNQARQSLMSEMMPLRQQAMEALKGNEPNLSAYESALKEIADRHVNAQVEAARVSQQALAVLTTEQRSSVRYTARLLQDMMGRGMMGAMMQGGMSGCP
ncbi:MAG: hypothetical protein GWN32_03470, partial [Gemmatimonadetes bacterium]|nr:hypothetical protein [Gemmatimonadota bacterium]